MQSQTMRRIILMISGAALLLSIFYMSACLIPNSEKRWKKSVCRLSAKSFYALPIRKGDTLFFSPHTGYAPNVALCADSLKKYVETSGVFVSQAGHVVTSDSLILSLPDTLSGDNLRKVLCCIDSLLRKQSKARNGELRELDYYASTHSVVDDGYNEVMAYRERVKKMAAQTNSLLLLANEALQMKKPAAYRHTHYYLHHFFKGGKDSATTNGGLLQAIYTLKECAHRENLLLLQLQDEKLPEWAGNFSIHRFGTFTTGRKLIAYNDFGALSATDSAEVITKGTPLFSTAEGGAWVNMSGQLCGLNRHGKRVSSRSVARLLRSEHCWPAWWWKNLSAKIKKLSDTSPKDGEHGISAKQYCLNKNTRIILPDSSVYEGQAIFHGKDSKSITPSMPQREGYGRLTLADGTIYIGVWQADTLACGLRIDSAGVYEGHFNSRLQAHGTGIYQDKGKEELYYGQWQEGRRYGHGFCSRANRMVRCGEWKNDRFCGERMVYTADRIYGIDISRYQHGRGHHYYPINWKRLRITSLGNGKRVAGNVDYAVSFIYIKATEGRSVYNKYYSADLRQARSHDIPAGSYHFFSPSSTGAQQAAYFLKMARVAKGDLPPVLDLEPTEKQIVQMGGDSAMFRQVLIWMRTVEKARGKRPILYVGQQFVNKHLRNAPSELRDYDVWVARYGEFKPYVRLLHWQLTPYGRVRGITGEVDINVFNGTKGQFEKYLQNH